MLGILVFLILVLGGALAAFFCIMDASHVDAQHQALCRSITFFKWAAAAWIVALLIRRIYHRL